MDRREFLKFVGFGSIVFFIGGIPHVDSLKNYISSKTPNRLSSFGKKFGMVIDAGACIGCRQCMYACKEENNVPDNPENMNWIDIFEMEIDEPITKIHCVTTEDSRTDYTESPKEGKWYLSVNCFHCENPPCIKVCPVGATFLSDDGIVEVNYDRCIGCRQCMAACPYNARKFNWVKPHIPAEKVNPIVPVRVKGVVEKCTFCQHRTREGSLPRCVEACPVGARHFGDLNDVDSSVSRILRTDLSYRLLEEMSTEPKIYYILSGKKWFPQEG
jgi:molybdopterin-containing oxidoreductase family iron-sulfur binding subunit